VFRETVLAIVRERYADFGLTLAAEKLTELHGPDLGVETLRQWMIAAGIWVRRKDRLKRTFNPAPGAIVWVSSCRSTVPSIGGSRTAARNARCSFMSTMPPAA